MREDKTVVLKSICYTELVYERINKKLNSNYSKDKIEKMIFNILVQAHESDFVRKGKNFYVSNEDNNIRITINSNTYRVITVDVLNKEK